MGAIEGPEYESLDAGSRWPAGDAKTKSSAVKHNGAMGPIPVWSGAAGEQSVAAGSCQTLVPGRGEGIKPAIAMSTEFLTQTDSDAEGVAALGSHDLDNFLGKAFDEQSTWGGLWESIQDVFFPKKLPPLELTSTPIPVPDLMAVKTNPWAVGIASFVNLSIAALLLFFVGRAVIDKIKEPDNLTQIDVSAYQGPKMKESAGGGGGGGDRSLVDASKGKLPKLEKAPVTPPQVQTFDKPKLAMEPAINVQPDIQLPNDLTLPNIGMKSGPSVVLSNGTGSGSGMGSGTGGGLGSGNGSGYGPGSGWNTGGGLAKIGGDVSAPVVIKSVEAEFSDEARRAKYQGIVLVYLIVDAQGNPQNVRVVRPLGMGLDEKAMEAVRQYRFKPALKGGKTPVAVALQIEVNFRLF